MSVSSSSTDALRLRIWHRAEETDPDTWLVLDLVMTGLSLLEGKTMVVALDGTTGTHDE